MRRALFVSAAILLVPLVSADLLQAGTRISLEGPLKIQRKVIFDGNMTEFPALSPGGYPLVLQSPGTVLDSGWYDYQANGSLPKRIVVNPDGTMHIVWMSSPDTQAGAPNRSSMYIYESGGVFQRFGAMTQERAGFPSIAVLLNDVPNLGYVAAVGMHSSDDKPGTGEMRAATYTDVFQGVGAWTPHFDDPDDPRGDGDELLWGRIATHPVNGGITMAANPFRSGAEGNVWVAYLPPDRLASGNFDSWFNLTPDLGQFNDGDAEWPSLASTEDPANPKVGILLTDIGGDYRLLESTTGDFSDSNFTVTNITNFDNTQLDTVDFGGGGELDTTKIDYRPWHTAQLIYDLDGVPHAVWAEALAAVNQADGQVAIFSAISGFSLNYRIRHWDPNTGLSTVYTSPKGSQDIVNSDGLVNTLPSSWPSIGVSEDNQFLYVVWNEFRDEWLDDDPANYGYGEIFQATGINGDTTWTPADSVLNVTQSPEWDDRFPSIARINPGGEVHLLYLSDPEGSNFAFNGGFPTAPMTAVKLLYHPFEPAWVPGVGIGTGRRGGAGSLPKAFALGQNYPNPFNPTTSISYTLAEASRVTLQIHNVRGQMVRELVSGREEAGPHSVQWDGKDSAGNPVSSGVYLYSMETDTGLRAVRKMVVLK